MLAALGIFLGFAAIVGYRDIKEKAGEIARKAAEAKIDEYFEKIEQRDSIREAIPSLVREERTDAANHKAPE